MPLTLVPLLAVLGMQTPAAQQTPGAPSSAAAVTARASTVADSLARTAGFSGVVVVAKDDTPIFERAYGEADREHKRANVLGTAFNISSIGKLITRTAIEQLAARGIVSLDSTVGKYLPDYPNADVARQVTLRQLLDHRSGVSGNIFQKLQSLRSNADYLALFATEPLNFPPGTKSEYSNAGYVLLGAIVERMSHEDFYTYIQRHIFTPAGMTHSGYFAQDSLPAYAAIGYTSGGPNPGANAGGPLRPNTDVQPMRGSAAGGAYATASDLLRFVIARRNGSLNIGGTPPSLTIAGGSPGSNGFVAMTLPGGYDVIVLANLDPPAAEPLTTSIVDFIRGGKAPAGQRVGAGTGAVSVWPTTAAGRAASDYVRAFNAGTEAVRQLLTTAVVPNPTRSMSDRIAGYENLHADLGALTLANIDAASDTSLSATFRAEKGGTVAIQFQIEPSGAQRLTSILFGARMP
jgi:CubicO group peptidase (beta-lactamase class C family)